MAGITLSGTYFGSVVLSNPATQDPVTVTSTARLGAGGGTALAGAAGFGWAIDNSGTILTPGGFGISLASGGMIANTAGGLISGTYDGIYSAGAAVTVTNAGRIVSADHAAVHGRLGGAVTNASTGTIFGFAAGVAFDNGGTVLNAGSIGASGSTAAGVRLVGGGFLSNASTGTIASAGFALYAYLASTVVVNDGVMTGAGEPAIVLRAGGTVTNGVGARMSGHYSAVHIEGDTGTVTNAGTITSDGGGIVLGAGGVASIAATGVVRTTGGVGVALGGAGTVMNAGTIIGTDNGVLLAAGGTLINSGGILGYSALRSEGAPAVVVNSGTLASVGNFGIRLNAGGSVTNLSGGVIASTAYGIGVFAGAGTVDNAGGILGLGGRDAVRLATGFANRVILRPGGGFVGGVNGGNGPAAAIVSTLELAADGTLAGTISGIGSQFVNFGHVTVDDGAVWALAGSNSFIASTVADGAGMLDVTGSLLNRGTILSRIMVAGGSLANGGTIQSAGVAVDANGGSVVNQASGVIAGGTAGIAGVVFGVTNAGAIGGGAYGMDMFGGSVLNLAGATIAGGVGIRVGVAGALVNNLGTITGTGGTAVQFGGGADRLVVHAGSVFGGIVDGAGGADVLELAADARGVISGVGTNFTGFETLAVQAGGLWRMTGQDTLAGGGTLAIGAGGTLMVGGTLHSDGSMTLSQLGELRVAPQGAVVVGFGRGTDGAVTVQAGQELSGIGRIRGNVVDKGTITASGGGLRIVGDVSGAGTIAIDAGSVMAVSGALGARHVTFLPGGGTLQLGTPEAMTAKIAGFGAGDTIDLGGIGLAVGVSMVGQDLTVHEAGGGSLVLRFTGLHDAGRFIIGDDGSGGTLLGYH